MGDADIMCFTVAKTKRDALLTAIADFNRRRRMTDLLKHAGAYDDWSSR